MHDTITIRPDLELVHVRSTGVLEFDYLMISLQTVATVARGCEYHRVLVNATEIAELPPVASMYDFGEAIANHLGGMHFAVVHSDGNREKLEFMEDVCANRGLVARSFTDEAKATEWLINDTPAG